MTDRETLEQYFSLNKSIAATIGFLLMAIVSFCVGDYIPSIFFSFAYIFCTIGLFKEKKIYEDSINRVLSM